MDRDSRAAAPRRLASLSLAEVLPLWSEDVDEDGEALEKMGDGGGSSAVMLWGEEWPWDAAF